MSEALAEGSYYLEVPAVLRATNMGFDTAVLRVVVPRYAVTRRMFRLPALRSCARAAHDSSSAGAFVTVSKLATVGWLFVYDIVLIDVV